MRISRERSGNAAGREDKVNRGAGEYEWAGIEPGVDPSKEELLNRRVLLRLPNGVSLDTACDFDHQGGKWRTRTATNARSGRYIYPIYHISVAMMMPLPTREHGNLGRGLPVLRKEEYFMEDIISGDVVLTTTNSADFEVVTIRVSNHTIPNGEDIDAAVRFGQVGQVWQNRGKLPEELAGLLQEHEQLVRGGDQISITGLGLIDRIQRATADASQEASIGVATARIDPLPALLEMVGAPGADEFVIPIEEIAPEFPEIRRRELARQRRLAAARGPAAVRFRRNVREAYQSTCIVCGLRLPPVWDGGQAGVDSAHILPDSAYDVNDVANGLCLCKMHHWAFDEGLIEIRFEEDAVAAGDPTGYSIVVPGEVRDLATSSLFSGVDLAFLRSLQAPIPRDRLPSDRRQWPDPRYLRHLRELLYP